MKIMIECRLDVQATSALTAHTSTGQGNDAMTKNLQRHTYVAIKSDVLISNRGQIAVCAQ